MKKTLFLAGMLSVGLTYAQEYNGKVGVNTTEPKATIDLQPNTENAKTTATSNEGILAPRLSKTRVANIATPVEGTLVYVTNDTDSPISAYTGTDTKVKLITEKGYYYYNGTQWVSNNNKNIYNSNGILNSDRTLNGDNNSLRIVNLFDFAIDVNKVGAIVTDMIAPVGELGFLVEGAPFASKKKIYSYDSFQSFKLVGNGDRPVVADENGTLKISTTPTENIYNNNGTLNGNRFINGNDNAFNIANLRSFSIIADPYQLSREDMYIGVQTIRDEDLLLYGKRVEVKQNLAVNKDGLFGGNLEAYGNITGKNIKGRTLQATSLSKTGAADRNVVASADGTLKIGNPIPNVRWITQNIHSETDLRESDNGGFVYVNSTGYISIDVPQNLPIGFSCVVVRKGTGNVYFPNNTTSTEYSTLQSARGYKLRAQYSAVGVIKDTETTFTLTGDAVE